ncbi:hypothetical protein BP5796_05044 [Coleophoma crateriformis]|uniref:C2H2-type domain-containing protein n=1 Tax=Coleophoma crateriformis TaxID=565419 RepID=A0A3D8S259_9HELO|nr:hypothetical protein BP5796_05044 [Coleophoma crateriformis]
MQDFSHNENLANQMHYLPTSVLPIGSTEAGSAVNDGGINSNKFLIRGNILDVSGGPLLENSLISPTTNWNTGFDNTNPSIGNELQSPSFATPPNSGSNWSSIFPSAVNDNYPSIDGPIAATLNADISVQQQAFDRDNHLSPVAQQVVPTSNTTGPAQQQVFDDNYLFHIFNPILPIFDAAAPEQQQAFDDTYLLPVGEPLVATFNDTTLAQQQPIPCSLFPCTKTFTRHADRIRHETTAAIHNGNRGHICPVPGCRKGQDGGFSRADKLTEHMWKKHADLGYAKKA